MASTIIQNAPRDLDMLTFMSISNKYGSLMKSGRFAVRIIPVGSLLSNVNNTSIAQDLTYICEATDFPGRSLMNMDLRYYGPNQKLPFQSVYDDITMTFICRSQSMEREFFDDWMQIINPTTHFDFTYRNEYVSRIEMYHYSDVADDDNDFTPTYKITLENAYPLAILPQPLMWGDNQIQKLLVGMTFTKYYRDDFTRPTMTVNWANNRPIATDSPGNY